MSTLLFSRLSRTGRQRAALPRVRLIRTGSDAPRRCNGIRCDARRDRRPLSDLMMYDPQISDPFSALLPFATGSARTRAGRHRDMPIDVQENDKAIEIHADIPGVSKEQIQVDIDDHIVSISVTETSESDEAEDKGGVQWHHTERSHAFVKRSVRLPETADTDGIAATYTDGVLAVTVPKREAPEKVKRVTVS